MVQGQRKNAQTLTSTLRFNRKNKHHSNNSVRENSPYNTQQLKCYSLKVTGHLYQPQETTKLPLISSSNNVALRFYAAHNTFHFLSPLLARVYSHSNLGSVTLEKLEKDVVWERAVSSGASRCMDSAVACHFGDNWSALCDRCLSATAGLHSCQECVLSEGECGRAARPQTVWRVTLTFFASNWWIWLDRLEQKVKKPFHCMT